MKLRFALTLVLFFGVNCVRGERHCYSCSSSAGLDQGCDVNVNHTAAQTDCNPSYTTCLTLVTTNRTIKRACSLPDACATFADTGFYSCMVCSADYCNYNSVSVAETLVSSTAMIGSTLIGILIAMYS